MSTDRSVEILGIIQKEGNKATICYDTSYKTYVQARYNLSGNEDLILACKLTTNNVQYFFVDLLSFLLAYRYDLTTWEELLEKIKEHVFDEAFSNILVYTSVPSMQYFRENDKIYKIPTPFVSNMTERPLVYSLNYTNYVNVAYTNMKYSHIRNKENRRNSLPDLVFTKEKGKNIDLENTLVSVNGIVGLPVYNEKKNELFIKNGANMLRDAHYTDQNVVLLDFTKLLKDGCKLKTYKLYECAPELYFKDYTGKDKVLLTSITGSTVSGSNDKYATVKQTLETFIDRGIEYQRQATFVMTFYAPIESNNNRKLPVLCIGGKLFFPYVDKLDYSTYINGSDKYLKIAFKISMDELEKILAANLQRNGVFYGFTSIYRICIGYIISNMFTNKEYNYKFSSDEWKIINYAAKMDVPFVSIIETDKIIEITKVLPFTSVNEKTLNFSQESQGLLINRQTKEIIDYTAQKNEDGINVSITPQSPLYITRLDGSLIHEDGDGHTRNEIPDVLRYDRFTMEKEAYAYKDEYNKISPCEFLKDLNSLCMINILCATNTPISLIDNVTEEPNEEITPVYTSVYKTFKYPLKKKKIEKIKMYSKSTYTLLSDGTKKYDLGILNLPENYKSFDVTYQYNEVTNEWQHVFADATARIYYNETLYSWILSYSETDIIQSIGTNAKVPYLKGLEWLACNNGEAIQVSEPILDDEEGDPVEDEEAPDED